MDMMMNQKEAIRAQVIMLSQIAIQFLADFLQTLQI